MDIITRQHLIDAMKLLPQRELINVINLALESRVVELCEPEAAEARICLVELHRYTDDPKGPSEWDIEFLARPLDVDSYVTNGIGPTQGGGCCGFVIASYSKIAVCPICRNSVGCT